MTDTPVAISALRLRRATADERDQVCQYLREECGRGGAAAAAAIEQGRVTVSMTSDDIPYLKINNDAEQVDELTQREAEMNAQVSDASTAPDERAVRPGHAVEPPTAR